MAEKEKKNKPVQVILSGRPTGQKRRELGKKAKEGS